MFVRIGWFAVRRARGVVVGAVLATLLLGAVGAQAFGVLGSGGFDDPGSESSQAAIRAGEQFGGRLELVFVATADDGNVGSPASRAAGDSLLARMRADPRLSAPSGYWDDDVPALRSLDDSRALVVVRTTDLDDAGLQSLADEYSGPQGGALTVVAGGTALGTAQTNAQVQVDLLVSEAVAVPVIGLLLFVVFGSLVGAALPMVVAGSAIAFTLAALTVSGSVTDVSIFAVNLTTALGMGLAVDYSLLMISRFREELVRSGDTATAVARAVDTAGRTIAFSAATVAVALSALLVFPQYFLRSFAYAGVAVVVGAMLASVLVLPAILALLGPRVDLGRLPGRWRRTPSTFSRFWGRVAEASMRRPVLAAGPVVVVLVALALPLGSIVPGAPDERTISSDLSARVVGDAVRTDFDGLNRHQVLVSGDVAAGDLVAYARQLSRIPGVTGVSGPFGLLTDGGPPTPSRHASDQARPGAALLLVLSDLDSRSPLGLEQVEAVRAVPPPEGTQRAVFGDGATQLDAAAATDRALPLAAAWIVLTTLILLFLLTGSVWQPLRALVLNGLSLASTVGLVVLVFQEGYGSAVLGFTAAPPDVNTLILLFVIAFGLSMDYEVFVISRIRETHLQGAPPGAAVVHGLSRSGRIVTAAATLLAVSFFALCASQISFIQMLGLGAGVAILVDATLVRGVLVPVVISLLGRRAWWAPAPLAAIHRRFGISESEAGGPDAAAALSPPPTSGRGRVSSGSRTGDAG